MNTLGPYIRIEQERLRTNKSTFEYPENMYINYEPVTENNNRKVNQNEFIKNN